MDVLATKYAEASEWWATTWEEKRDRRVDGWFLMDSPWPTLAICLTYVYVVKVAGPRFMRDREPINIRGFLIVYNALQVAFSTYIFVELLQSGWGGDYSLRCQPVDYSDDPKALRMLMCCWLYFLSKFTEFFDTFAFVARKKFKHVSLLHVVHHGIMPISVWPGARFVPGGHASFFGFLNTFVHIFMYAYYLGAALGPQYSKYIWWKQHMTTLQMIQFVGIMVHGFQLMFYDDCDFPWQYGPYIAAHAVMFFVLFSRFYVEEYFSNKKGKADGGKRAENGHRSNGAAAHHQNGSAAKLTNGTSNGISNGIASNGTSKKDL